jgi:ABC-type phosphate transport system substrate-binding protein
MKLMKVLFTLSLLVLTLADINAQVVVVNKGNPTTELSPGQTKLLYLRKVKRLWPTTNKPIKPVDLKGANPVRAAFLNKVLGMTAAEVEQYFQQRQFANSESPPTEVQSEAQVIDFVAENDGAIGFVSEAVYEANKAKVKLLCKF